jgi:hypothetical protein
MKILSAAFLTCSNNIFFQGGCRGSIPISDSFCLFLLTKTLSSNIDHGLMFMRLANSFKIVHNIFGIKEFGKVMKRKRQFLNSAFSKIPLLGINKIKPKNSVKYEIVSENRR